MITPGKVLYQLYHRPIDAVRKTFTKGLLKTVQQHDGQKKMMSAATGLREIVYTGEKTFTVYFLTGKKYWFQTAFCLYSLQRFANVNIHAVIVDDGSFDDELETAVKRQFPSTVTIIRSSELQIYLDQKLPPNIFPVLRQRRIIYPHLRKLTDVHVLPGYNTKLVLDSDMLFFRQPSEMLEWLENPKQLLFLRDVTTSYGYSEQLMERLTGCSIPERLNVGVAGMPSSMIDWHLLEDWTKTMLESEGSTYLQEQALTAMIASGQDHTFLEESSYKVLPVIDQPSVPEILHHYVAESKYDYFVKGWKLCQASN